MNLSVMFGILACGLALTGCDDTPAVPEALKQPQPVETTAPARPTTQQLLSGPQNTISLDVLPMSVRAPAGWKVESIADGVVLLQGPTLSGDASIQLSRRPTTTPDRLEAIVSGARREMQQNPEKIRMVDLRDGSGESKVIERQSVGRTAVPVGSENDPSQVSPMYTWTITTFVPRGGNYDTYELNFIGLTQAQYDLDMPLLRQMMDSLKLDSAPGAAPTTAATAR